MNDSILMHVFQTFKNLSSKINNFLFSKFFVFQLHFLENTSQITFFSVFHNYVEAVSLHEMGFDVDNFWMFQFFQEKNFVEQFWGFRIFDFSINFF